MFLSEKYKTESFPNQYYEISTAPFILMGINPYSKLAWLIRIVRSDVIYWGEDGLLAKDWSRILYMRNKFKINKDDGIFIEVKNNQVEFKELVADYANILIKIKHSDLVLKKSIGGCIPTGKLIDFGRSNSKSTEGELKDFSETERNSMLKLIIGMAIDAYGYNPNSTRNSATGDKSGISAKLSTRGIDITDDTIRKYLTEAKKLIGPQTK